MDREGQLTRGAGACGVLVAAAALLGACTVGTVEQAPPSTSSAPPSSTAASPPASSTAAVTPTVGPDGTFGALVLTAAELPVPLVAQPMTAADVRAALSEGAGDVVADPPECAGASPAAPGALEDLGYVSATAASTGLTVREVVSTASRTLTELDAVVARCATSTATRGEVRTTTTIAPADAPAVPADAVRGYRLEVAAEVAGISQQRVQRALVAQLGPVQVVVTADNGVLGGEPDAALVDRVFTAAVAKVRG